MIKYKIYSTYRTLHSVGREVETVEEVIEAIENVIYKEDAHYLVIKRDFENNTEISYVTIYSIEEFNDFKNEYYAEQKENVKRYGK